MTRACEEAVRTLSASAQADVYIEAAHEGCDMNVKISRTRFEDLCYDLYKAAGGVVTKALAHAGCQKEEVDMVLLAGGERTTDEDCSEESETASGFRLCWVYCFIISWPLV